MGESKLRAGIVGLGVGQAHARGYLASQDAVIAALCDTDPTRLEELGAKWDVSDRYLDYRTMFRDAGLDVVSICLPNALHADATVAALEAGIHVICEKPMATCSADARRMLEAAARGGRQLMIAYNHRYRSDVRWMYQMAHSGRLGKIYHASAAWRRETGIPGSGWFGNRQLAGGGVMIDLGVHVIDLALWMMDFPAALTVSGDTRSAFGGRGLKTWGRPWGMESGQVARGEFEVEDGAIGFVRLGNEATLLIHVTWAEHSQPQEDAIRIELQGTEGTAVLHIRNYRSEDTLRFYTEMEGEPVTVIPGVRPARLQSHEALIVDLMDSLKRGVEPATNGQQGLASMVILDALYESAATGREVILQTESQVASL